MIITLQKSTDTIPFAIFRCESIEASENYITMKDKDGKIITYIGDYDFYHEYEEDNEGEEVYIIEQSVEMMKGNW
jgi:hypothetical protein